MARLLKCAIDSRPLSADAFTTYDYSGMQVHGLTTTPLSFFLGKTRLGGDGVCTLIPIAPGRTWSDGAPLTAAQYLAGLRHVLAKNAFVRRILFRKVKSIRVAQEALEIGLHRPNTRLGEILSLPNFCPLREDSTATSGEFARRGELELENQNGDRLQIQVVKAPEQNLELFSRGELDLTADTAFPYYRIDEYLGSKALRIQESGLYAALVFGANLQTPEALPIRRFLDSIADSCDFNSVTYGVCRLMRDLHGGGAEVAESPRERAPLRALRLAYDDFYPNREICEVIASRLAQFGVKTTLVQDDYYAPSAAFDVKFCILRGLANTPYLRYAGMLFNDVLAKMPEARARYAASLERLEVTDAPHEMRALYESLAQTLRETAALVPLFSVPSMYLSKLEGGVNPLLLKIGVA